MRNIKQGISVEKGKEYDLLNIDKISELFKSTFNGKEVIAAQAVILNDSKDIK